MTKKEQKRAEKEAKFKEQLIAMGGKFAEQLHMQDRPDLSMEDEHAAVRCFFLNPLDEVLSFAGCTNAWHWR